MINGTGRANLTLVPTEAECVSSNFLVPIPERFVTFGQTGEVRINASMRSTDSLMVSCVDNNVTFSNDSAVIGTFRLSLVRVCRCYNTAESQPGSTFTSCLGGFLIRGVDGRKTCVRFGASLQINAGNAVNQLLLPLTGMQLNIMVNGSDVPNLARGMFATNANGDLVAFAATSFDNANSVIFFQKDRLL